MIRIYHNSRCSKSREGLKIVQDSGKEYQVRDYLKYPLSEKELEEILHKLDIKPIELVRKNESLWKEKFRSKVLSDNEIKRILLENPKLIERPIVESENGAVIGRPPHNIKNLLNPE